MGSLAALITIALAFSRAIQVSMMERNAPFSASYSVNEAKHIGTFARRAHVSPEYILWRDRKIPIVDVWIERVSDLNYTLLFFPHRTYRSQYRLVILPGVPTSTEYDFLVTDHNASYFASQSSGLHNPFVLTYELGKRYPDTLNFLVLDEKNKEVCDSLTVVAL